MRASNRRPNRPRWCFGALAAAAALILVPSSAWAADPVPGLPGLNVPTAAPSLPQPLATLLPPLPGLPSLPGATAGSTRTTSSTAAPGTSSPTGLPGSIALPLPGPTTPTSSPTTTPSGGRATPQSQPQPQTSVGGGLAGAGYGCLSAGSANGGGLVVMDQDLLGQLAAVLPQTAEFEVPCTTRNGLALDADLVAATVCLRLDPSSPTPVRATVELAGTDVLGQLEAAGLPLGQVLSPCATAPPAQSGSDATSPARAGATSSDAPTQVQAAATADTGGRLPFTGAQVLPTVLLALALLLLGAGLLRGRGQHQPTS